MSRIITATTKQDSPETVTVELREQTENLLLGYLEVTLVPVGARVEAWNADDSDVDGRLIIKAERPEVKLPNPCIHTPPRCNGGGYDGCACGPYPVTS